MSGLPMDVVLVLEETDADTMHGRIAPSLVKEPSSAIEVVKVGLIGVATPQSQIRNFKVCPEMTGAETIGQQIVLWSAFLVNDPVHCIVMMQVVCMRGNEILSLGPERSDCDWVVVQCDIEAICLVSILHEAKDVVVYIAKEVYMRLDTPVVLHIF